MNEGGCDHVMFYHKIKMINKNELQNTILYEKR